MKIRRITAILVSVILTVTSFSVYADTPDTQPDAEQELQVVEYSNYILKNMVRVYAHSLADNYYYGIDDNELLFSVICNTIDEGEFDINKALEAMVDTLDDEHSEFYTPEEYAAMVEDVTGEFSGIGVTITQNKNGIVVLDVFDKSPALRAGIMSGDYITAIDGASVEGMNISQVRNLIVGKNGSEVHVTLMRGASEVEAVCIRDTVQVSHTETMMLTDDIAYLRLVQFTKNAAEEVAAYVKELQSKSVKKLVFDLRDNPGGEIDAAIDIANVFISAGQIAQLRYKDEAKNTYIYSENYNAPRMKIVVLVNENSASASEFLSMAFQGRGAAKLIGTKTFGKGSMQVLMRVATGAGMKYTVGEFFTAKGKRVHTIGITPDIVVENEYIPVDEESFAKIDYDRIGEATQGGEMTLALEQRLSALGILEEEPDSVYTDATTDAVARFQALLGYDMNGIPGFYEFLYLNDYSYDFDIEIDKQLEAAIEYLK